MDLVQQFYHLNDEKYTLEVCLILFKQCNLKCAFCFQDHSGIDVDYVKSIPENLIQQYKKLFSHTDYKNITYRIWGGELFSDDISDDMFELYYSLSNSLYDIGKMFNKHTTICFSSNLIFTKTNRVKQLLNDTNSILATSYDPLYRFHDDQQVCLWKENAELLKPHTVSITLTKQNIYQFINNKKHFELLKNYSVNIEYYIYNKLYDFFKPSEEELFQFFKYCIDNDVSNIPEVSAIVKSYNNPIGRYCSCNNSCLYIDGELTFNCLRRSSNLPIDQFFNCNPTEDNYTEQQLKEALNRKNCITCKNFSFCRMYCLASVLHSSYDGSNCGFYRIYEYIKEKYGK